MEYKKKNYESETELFLLGKLISEDRDEFIKIINDFVKSPQKTFIVNLEDITFVDSAGLGFMFIALQELNNVSKELILRKPQGHVKDLFELLNFQSVFTVEF